MPPRRAALWALLLGCVPVLPCLQLDPDYSVHAFYYMWYGEPSVDGAYRHWDHEQLPHWDATQAARYPSGKLFAPPDSLHSPFYPWRGPYSSQNATIVQQHIAELLEAGVRVVVVSWWGPKWRQGTTDSQGVNTDDVLALIVREVERVPAIKVAFHMEPYPGRTAATFKQDVQHLLQEYGASSALLRVGGARALPVFYVYDSYRTPPREWAAVLTPGGADTVRDTPLDGVFLGLWLNANDGDELLPSGFDGCYTYFASDAVSYASQPGNWPALHSWAQENGKLFVASVGPGYDDTRIRPWNGGATRPRKDGERYRDSWNAAIAAAAHGISITSYNEWGEGTQIEPARPWRDASGHQYQDYGLGEGPHLYMRLTRDLAARYVRQLREQQQQQQQQAEEQQEEVEEQQDEGEQQQQQQEQQQEQQEQRQQQEAAGVPGVVEQGGPADAAVSGAAYVTHTGDEL